ncbi:serine/threonine-protein kinase [Actinoplanes sp. NPDC049118]|uniref:serine/threonine-protein kinase n=1 Tax=Actinoplanes sp. NPDC049118 TaxID=3155769 RepID=UPI003408FC0F
MQDTDRIDRYRIVSPLGEGSFSTVFLAVDEELESRVAIKVLAPRWNLDADVRERFLDEARLLRRLESRRLVRIYDIGQLPDGRPYFVMEHADLGTLQDRLDALAEAGETVSLGAAIAAARQVALALSRVHEAGVVHRDIKPGNILLFTARSGEDVDVEGAEPVIRPGERLALGDFGLAKDLSRGATGYSIAVGTPGYMPPEQAAAAAVSQAADVYACSALLFRLLVGEPPAPVSDSVQRLHDSPAGPAVRDVIIAGLAPAPASRQPSALSWLRVLDEAHARDSGVAVRPARAGRSAPRRRRAALAAAAATTLLAAAAGVHLATRAPARPPLRAVPSAGVVTPVAYQRIYDDSRRLSLEVPRTWTQHVGNGWHPGLDPFFREVNVGPGLNAAPNVNDWFSEAAMPGAFAGASSRVVREGRFSPDSLAKVFGPSGCTAENTGPFAVDRLRLSGRTGTWVCNNGARWRYAYLWPGDHRYLLAVEVKLVGAADDAVWQHMLDTVTLHGKW